MVGIADGRFNAAFTSGRDYHARVQRLVLRIITAIQLTRLTMAFGAVADVWFVILLTRAHSEYNYLPVFGMNLSWALLAGATVAIGLFAFGASLNDVLDVRHDGTFSPERPIPAGRIRLGQAIVLTVGALIVAMLGGIQLGIGAAGMTLIAATCILFYNAAGKFIPAIGLITVGLIHAVHMRIPNYQLEFMLPVWLVMSHAMVVAALVHHLEDKRPRLGPRAIVATIVGWLVWSAILFAAAGRLPQGMWPDDASWWGILLPIGTVVAFGFVAWWKVSGVTGAAAAEKLKRYGAMWQALYGAAWLAAVGLPTQAIWLGLFALAGFAGMTLIKEITGFSDRPVAYR